MSTTSAKLSSHARKAGGVITAFLLLLMLPLTLRQFNTWYWTGDRFYLFSWCIYLVIDLLLLGGSAYGLSSGNRADKIFGVGGFAIGLPSFFAALYYWTVGFFGSGGAMEIYNAIVFFLTGAISIGLVVIGEKIAERKRS